MDRSEGRAGMQEGGNADAVQVEINNYLIFCT